MFLDASAIIAIMAREEEGAGLAARLAAAERVCTSAIAIYEAALALARLRNTSATGAEAVVHQFLAAFEVEIIPITAEIGRGAVLAFEQFGRGQRPARLNMGDCFAYACARALDVPLLFKGDDFGQTDIAPA
jgi:ribonuclease VapC